MKARKTVVALGTLGSATLAGGITPEATAPVAVVTAAILWLATRPSREPSPAPVPSPPPGALISTGAGEASTRGHVEYARGVISEAALLGVLDDETVARLMRLLSERLARSAASVPTVPPSVPSLVPDLPIPPVAQPASVDRIPVRASMASDRQQVDGRAVATRRLRRIRELVASDVAVNGLAYLGVLLLFAGTLGFLLVSFTTVRDDLRPVAELAMPVVLLGSAWFLRRRGAPVVATSLGLLGGLLLPVVLATSFVDGVPFPPELHGGGLAVTLTATMVVLAAGYGAYARRHPQASLRYLVAPMLWAACWSLGLLLTQDAEALDLRRWTSAQFALVTLGVALTSWLGRRRPTHPLAQPTLRAAPIGLVVSYGVAIGLAAVEGWPPAEVIVAGIGALAALEALARARIDAIRGAQLGVLAVTCAALVPTLGVGAVGAIVTLGFIVALEREVRRGAPTALVAASATGAAIGLIGSSARPVWGLIAGVGISVWAHARRFLRRGELEPAVTIAAAILPLAAAVELMDLVGAEPGLAILGAGALVSAVALRSASVVDPFPSRWLAAAAGVVVFATAAAEASGGAADRGLLTLGAAAAALTIAVTMVPPTIRVWGTALSLAWASWLGGLAADWSIDTRLLVPALLGAAAAVTLSLPTRRTKRSPTAGHVAAAGAIAVIPALVAARGDGRLLALGSWCALWLVMALVQQNADAPIVRLVAGRATPRLVEAIRLVPAAAVASGVPFLVSGVLTWAGIGVGHRSWTGVALAAVAIAYAGAAGAARPRSPVARVMPAAAFGLSLVAIAIAAPDAWPTIEAVASLIVTVLLLRGLRGPVMTWTAWVASGALAPLLVARTGLSAEYIPVVVVAWGGLLMLGALVLDDVRSGRRAIGEGIRLRWLVPPLVMGSLATPIGLGVIAAGRPSQAGAWALAGAVLYLVTAMRLRSGSITVVAWSLVTFSIAVLVPTPPMQDPRLFAPWVAILALAARIVSIRAGEAADRWNRWDLPIVAVAHGTALVAIARATAIGETAPTWTAMGAIALVAAVLWRAPAYAVVGILILLVAGAAAGPGWFAIALLATATASAVGASRTSGILRDAMRSIAALSLAAAWWQLGRWAGWSSEQAAVFTAAAGAVLVIVAGATVRWVDAPSAPGWSAYIGLLSVSAALAGVSIEIAEGSRHAMHVAAALAAIDLAALGSALALVAAPLRMPIVRVEAAVSAGLAGALAAYAADLPPASVTTGAAVCGLVATSVGLALSRREAPWRDAFAVLAIACLLVAIVGAGLSLPGRGAMEAVLTLGAIECAAAGTVLRRRGPIGASAVLLCAAWLLYASASFAGEIQLVTVPIGLAILVVASLARAAAHEGDRPTPFEVVALECSGMAFVVLAGLVEGLSVSPVRAATVVMAGAALATWGALTRVRRRAAFGLGAATLAAIEIPGAALLPLAPRLSGPALWAALLVAGVVVLAVAVGLERGRATIRTAIMRLDDLTEGWE